MTITIATRGSALALWQANQVAQLLAAEPAAGDDSCQLVIVETVADRRLDIPIWQMGGKGVFVKEVQAAVLDGRARVAVHSGKDLPAVTHPDLVIAAVPPRADARDVLVGATLDGLAPGAVIATGSVRRRAQLAWRRPDLTFAELRGNIATRLSKIPAGGSIVMAAAALERLDLFPSLAARGVPVDLLSPGVMLPQVAQGALAIECRHDDHEMIGRLAALDHPPTRRAFDAERSFLAELGGDCDLPAGAHATVCADRRSGDGAGSGGAGEELSLDGLLASLDGHTVLRIDRRGDDPVALGREVARHLLDDAGGAALLGR